MIDRARDRIAKRARYEARKVAGLCVRCGCSLLPEWLSTCPECTAAVSDAQRRYRKTAKGRKANRARSRKQRERRAAAINARRRELREARQVQGVCLCCQLPASDGDYCAGHAEWHRAKCRKSAAEKFAQRSRAGVCVRCGGDREPGLRKCKRCLAEGTAYKARKRERLLREKARAA